MRRLRQIKPISDSGARLYLKLAVRMQVWPDMKPGPFLYPYSDGLALFLLNSHCIEALPTVTEIEKDLHFRSLVAAAEHRIVANAYNFLSHTRGESSTIAFAQREFVSEPSQVGPWCFTDYSDLWLWQYTRDHCYRRDQQQAGADLGCALVTGGATSQCYCDSNDNRWRKQGNMLRRD
jgi:hypothetical protein